MQDKYNTVVAIINTGVTPTGFAVTPDNCFAYVANEDTVSVLNLKNNTVKTTIFDKSFNEPYRVTINAAGTRAYVANTNSTTLSIIDLAINAVTGVIDGFDGPSGMVITRDDIFGYVNNYGFGDRVGVGTTVSVVDLRTNTIVRQIQVGLAPSDIAMSPDGAFVYTVNAAANTMSVIQTSTGTVVDTIPGFSGPFAMAITPYGRCAYVTNFDGNTVSVVDLCRNTVFRTIDVGLQPAGLAVTKDGCYVYVANYNTFLRNGETFTAGQGSLTIIATETNEVIPPTIATANTPDWVVVGPSGRHLYVSNFLANVVSVIALPC